jgi:hypothetical protein
MVGDETMQWAVTMPRDERRAAVACAAPQAECATFA